MRNATKLLVALGLAAGAGLALSANDTANAQGVYQTRSTHVVIRHRAGYEAMASADACPAGSWMYRPQIGRGPWRCDPAPAAGVCMPGTVMVDGLCRPTRY